jgi:hypothetical protein
MLKPPANNQCDHQVQVWLASCRWLIVVNPAWFAIQGSALWWQIVSFVQLNDFMSSRGYTFFIACFYLLIVGLIVSVAIRYIAACTVL